ncbi:MAG: hypothetical protein EXR72_05615 [Myxococcales bacterium]|nr:hypothetical protein [Myxococcales bacterium]
MRFTTLTKYAFVPFLALAACGPTWVVVKQATPNTLQGKKAFSVEAWNWEKVSIGSREKDRMSVADYVAKKKPEEQEKWKEAFGKDQEGAAEKFKERLTEKGKGAGLDMAAAAGADTFVIKPSVKVYEPGFFSPVGFGSRGTEVHLTIEIADGAGAVLDEVQFLSIINPSIYTPSTGQRIRQAAIALADQANGYIQSRTGGK